jgi:hypothetical protein
MAVVANQAVAFDKSMLTACPHLGDVLRPNRSRLTDNSSVMAFGGSDPHTEMHRANIDDGENSFDAILRESPKATIDPATHLCKPAASRLVVVNVLVSSSRRQAPQDQTKWCSQRICRSPCR